MNSLTPLFESIVGQRQEVEDASHDSPNVNAAAGDKGDATNQKNPDDATSIEGLERVAPPRVSIQDRDRRESSEFAQQQQDNMKGMLKLLLDNQKTLQKKLDDQQEELTSLMNVSEEDSLDNKYNIRLGRVECRPRRRNKKQRTGQLSNIIGYDANLSIAPEPAPTNSQKFKFVRYSDIPGEDLVNSQLILCQENYRNPATNPKTHTANMKLATQPLSVLLGVTYGHRMGHTQDQKNFVHIQTQLMTTKQKVDELEERADECDFTDTCYYSKLKGAESDRCVDWWDGSSNNILKTWDTLSFGEACA